VLAIDLLGVIPEDEKIVVSTNRGEPAVVDEMSKAGQAFRNMIRRLEGENIPLMSMDNIEPSFMDKLRMFFGLKARAR
jgi:septum site-determining protein MinD